MSVQAYIGDIGLSEQPSVLQFREGAGWQRVRTWNGAKRRLNQFTLPPFAVEVDYELGAVDVTVRAVYQIVDPVALSWELHANDLELTLWEHPKFQAILDFLESDDSKAALVSAIITGRNESPPTPPSEMAAQLQESIVLTNDQSSDLQKFYVRLLCNQDTFITSQFVLRKTMLLSPQADTVDDELRRAYTNTQGIFTYNRLIAEEPTLIGGNVSSTEAVWTRLQDLLANGWTTDQPIGTGPLLVSGTNIVEVSLLGPAGLNLQWQKRTAQTQAMQRGMFQLTLEYWGAKKFDTWKYDLIA